MKPRFLPMPPAVLCGLVLLAGSTVAHAQNGGISGMVTESAGGAPVADVFVDAQPASGPGTSGNTYTAADGSYVISGLPAGNYKVTFWPEPPLTSEYYNNTRDWDAATLVTVTAGLTTSDINAALEIGGSITGVVTGPDGVSPLEGVQVTVSNYDTGAWGGQAFTAADGTYEVTGLNSGNYDVWFSPASPLLSEYYDNVLDWLSRTPVAVVAGAATSGINASLAEGASISGTVSGGAPPVPLDGALVEIYVQDPFGWLPWWSANTQPDGTYSVGGLPAGTYRVRFSASGMAPEFYDNAASVDVATDLVVAAGAEVTGINAVLDPGASISGTVTGPDGVTGLGFAYVAAYSQFGGLWVLTNGTSAAADGTYLLDGLAPGSYRLRFEGSYPSPYIAEWYDNTTDPNSATTLPLAAGTALTGVNASLALGGSISGTVTEPGLGGPVSFAVIYCYDPSGAFITSAYSGFDGTYSLLGLPGGNYRVEFSHPDYATEYYNDEVFFSLADQVAVTVGVNTPGINAVLAPGASIYGTVTGPDGVTPVSGATIEALLYNGTSWEIIGSHPAAPNGTYRVRRLPAGSYVVQFSAPGYQTEFYDNKPDPGTATQVPLSEAGTVTGIDASLSLPDFTWVFVEELAKTGPGAFDLFFAASANDWFQLQKTGTFASWTNVGSPVQAVPWMGDVGTNSIPVSTTEPKEFWRLIEAAP